LGKEYAAFATENKGIFRIGAVNCAQQEAICTKEKVATTPVVRVYPPFPAPAFDVAEVKNLRNAAGKYINDRAIEITTSNIKTFVEEDIATPKVLIFTNAKKGTPFIIKALSEQFEVS